LKAFKFKGYEGTGPCPAALRLKGGRRKAALVVQMELD
jgi:hypothetical protein